jgi:hypothetical protein
MRRNGLRDADHPRRGRSSSTGRLISMTIGGQSRSIERLISITIGRSG